VLRQQLPLSRRVRDERSVVLILTNHRLTLCRENADNTKGRLRTRIDSPIGSNPAKSLSATVLPSTMTREADRTSPSVKNAPCSTFQLRICGNFLVLSLDAHKPILIAENQLSGGIYNRGAAAIVGTSALAIALTSSSVSELAGAGAQALRRRSFKLPGMNIHHVRAMLLI